MSGSDDKKSRNKPKRFWTRKTQKIESKNPERVNSDDVEIILETLLDEATPIGIVKRTAQRIELRVARKYISEIAKLKDEKDTLTETIAYIVESGTVLKDLVNSQQSEIQTLQAELDRLNKVLVQKNSGKTKE